MLINLQNSSFRICVDYFFLFLSILFILVIVLYSKFNCAHKVAPSGGPEDKTPPVIVNHFPNKDTTGITHLDYLEIEFSEPIRKVSLSNNYWMIPELSAGIEAKWKGNRKIRFFLNDSLEQDQTFVFMIGTGVTDMRNNNLVSPFQLAFSTGDMLDTGAISGEVFSDTKEKEVYIYAYSLNEVVNIDSLLFKKSRYYTQIDAQGKYRLNYLAFGEYRLIALSDKDYNSYYSIETDLIGIPFQDVKLDSMNSIFTNMNFYLIQEDTTAPQIKNIDVLSLNEISIQFNEDIQPDSVYLVVRDSLTEVEYPILASSVDPGESDKISLFFSDLPPERSLLLIVRNLKDSFSNIIQTDSLIQSFTSPVHPDTLSPSFIGMLPKPGTSDAPYNSAIIIQFNSPIDTATLLDIFELKNNTSEYVNGKFDFLNLRKPTFTPDTLLRPNMTYNLELNLRDLKDIFGRSFPDTTLTLSFTTIDMANLGEISGIVYVPDTSWYQAIIRAEMIMKQDRYQDIENTFKEYRIDFVPGGFYFMSTVIDVNGNEQWDKGKTVPWKFSEPFIFKSDTVRVRKRWTTKGINFYFNFRGNE